MATRSLASSLGASTLHKGAFAPAELERMPPLGSLILEIQGRTRSSLRHAQYAPLRNLPPQPDILYRLYVPLVWKVHTTTNTTADTRQRPWCPLRPRRTTIPAAAAAAHRVTPSPRPIGWGTAPFRRGGPRVPRRQQLEVRRRSTLLAPPPRRRRPSPWRLPARSAAPRRPADARRPGALPGVAQGRRTCPRVAAPGPLGRPSPGPSSVPSLGRPRLPAAPTWSLPPPSALVDADDPRRALDAPSSLGGTAPAGARPSA